MADLTIQKNEKEFLAISKESIIAIHRVDHDWWVYTTAGSSFKVCREFALTFLREWAGMTLSGDKQGST